MFNGMIAPVVGLAIRGVLWYQGESITAPRELFPHWNETLITDWRKLWGRELPFYFCQLSAQQAASNGPDVRAWQAEALALPGTGMAVTIDVGDEKNVHPKNKAPVGNRLARSRWPMSTAGRSNPPARCWPRAPPRQRAAAQVHARGGGLVEQVGGAQDLRGRRGRRASSCRPRPLSRATPSSCAAGRAGPDRRPLCLGRLPEGCNLFNAAGLPAAPFQTSK